MKLLFAIKAMHEITGGAERVLADITGELARRGHEVVILTYDVEGAAPFYPLDPKARLINLGLGDPKRKARFFETLKRMTILRFHVAREKPDVVIGFMHSMFVPAAFALIGSKIPLIASEHIVPEHYKGKPVESFLFLLSSFFIERYTALSQAVRDSYPGFLRARMVPIPNPVRVPAQLPEKAQKARKLLLSVGRLDPQKDFRTLISAFGQIAAKHPDWDLRIIGEGPLRASLEKEIADLHLQDRATLAGATRDIEPHYREADLFVMPSQYESFGLACAEALARGVPAVAFAECKGLNEIIQDDVNGVLVPPGPHRAQGLADDLDLLMDDEDKRKNLAARAPASVAHFSLADVADRWEALLRDVAKK